MTDPGLVELLDAGTRLLIRSVDGMADEEWAEPSLLPRWTRSHVVAHLTLNAEGLSAALEGVHEGRQVPMYASLEARNHDIDELATTPPSQLRDRFMGSTSVIDEWVEELAENLAEVMVERTPGGRQFPAGDVGLMRVREVHIHHADLGLGYTAADWSPDFLELLLGSRAASHAGPTSFTARATDLDRSWAFGAGGPTVSGTGSTLAWWVTGRPLDQVPGGDGLSSDDGQVPRMEPW
jgi:maleylpyruvate isomerase